MSINAINPSPKITIAITATSGPVIDRPRSRRVIDRRILRLVKPAP